MAATVDVETHVNAAQLGRIEADLEPVAARLRARGDLDREAGERNGRNGRLRGGTRRRRRRCHSSPLRRMLYSKDLHALRCLGLGDIAGVHLGVRRSRQFGIVCSYAAGCRSDGGMVLLVLGGILCVPVLIVGDDSSIRRGCGAGGGGIGSLRRHRRLRSSCRAGSGLAVLIN